MRITGSATLPHSASAGTRRTGWITLIGWGALGLVLVVLASEIAFVLVTMPHVDWQTYTNAWARLVHGGSIYGAMQLGGPYPLIDAVLVGYAYPPPAVVLMAPFTIAPL